MPQPGDTQPVTLRDYVRVVMLRWWLVAIVVIACTLTAFLMSARAAPLYSATASLMYQQAANIANPLGSNFGTDVNGLALETQSVVNTVGSPEIKSRAKGLLSGSPGAQSYKVTASILQPDSSSGGTVSDVVGVTAEGPEAATSAAVANAYAEAVITTRVEREQARLRAAQDAILTQMEAFTTGASKLSTDYLLLAQRLRDLQVAEATATGDFRIIHPATVPEAPSSPKPRRTAVVAFVGSLLAGVALAFIVGQFDTRIRTHRHVTEILALPVVGRIPRVSRDVLRDGTLVTLNEPASAPAEALRMLRSNLSWSSIDREWKSLLITSSEKGEGKTLTICNLAVALALTGKKVVVVDADLRAPRVHTAFSLPNRIGLTTVIMEATRLEDALTPFSLNGTPMTHVHMARGQYSVETATDDDGTLTVLTSGPLPPNPGEVVASRKLASVIADLTESDVDYVLVDAPPLLNVGDVGALAHAVDALLLVVNVGDATRPMLEDTREALDALPCRKLGVVIVGERMEPSTYYNYGLSS